MLDIHTAEFLDAVSEALAVEPGPHPVADFLLVRGLRRRTNAVREALALVQQDGDMEEALDLLDRALSDPNAVDADAYPTPGRRAVPCDLIDPGPGRGPNPGPGPGTSPSPSLSSSRSPVSHQGAKRPGDRPETGTKRPTALETLERHLRTGCGAAGTPANGPVDDVPADRPDGRHPEKPAGPEGTAAARPVGEVEAMTEGRSVVEAEGTTVGQWDADTTEGPASGETEGPILGPHLLPRPRPWPGV